jgi:hypothetical protein
MARATSSPVRLIFTPAPYLVVPFPFVMVMVLVFYEAELWHWIKPLVRLWFILVWRSAGHVTRFCYWLLSVFHTVCSKAAMVCSNGFPSICFTQSSIAVATSRISTWA